jgi:flagellar hook-length control protein FliK
MKPSGISPQASGRPPAAASKTEQDRGRKSFSKVLEGRRGNEKAVRESKKLPTEEGEPLLTARDKSEAEEAAMRALTLPFQSLAQFGEVTPDVSSAQPVAPKQPIQALVQEITHSVSVQGQEQVDIQLNSKVFDGLKIQIVRQPGAFDIRFESASDKVAQLLSRNEGALAQSLAAHGVPVGQIRVNESESTRWMNRKFQSRAQSSGQGRRR